MLETDSRCPFFSIKFNDGASVELSLSLVVLCRPSETIYLGFWPEPSVSLRLELSSLLVAALAGDGWGNMSLFQPLLAVWGFELGSIRRACPYYTS